MSSDYIDYLEAGMKPKEDSQYWVAPFIQEIFSDVIDKKRPDIATELKNNSEMQLE